VKAAVTGANGFVGQRVVALFAERGVRVRAAARSRPDALAEGVEWAAAPDLGPDADWSTVVAGMDVVVHCAARVHVMHDSAADPLAEFRRVNVAGTLALARAAVAAGVKRFVFLSSIKVNGEGTPPDRPYRADDTPAPVDPYGVSKLEAEQALFALAAETGMEVTVTRPVLVYGPGVRANFRAMMAVVAKGLPLPLGAVHNRRSMVFVGNLADLVYAAATHPAAAGQVLLVSDGEDMSTSAMLRALGTALGKPARLVPVPVGPMRFAATLLGKRAVAQRLFGSLAVDIAPTRALLGWSPPFSVALGFAKSAQAYRAEA
jgi:nucleoside-diphosphate-sugar epimerase